MRSIKWVTHFRGSSICPVGSARPGTKRQFHDNFLDIDYGSVESDVIATANDLSTIAGPLRDRMEIIEVTGYLMEENGNR